MSYSIKDCPRARPEDARDVPSGSGRQKKIGAARKVRVSARVYAIDRNEVESEADVVEGTLIVFGKLDKILVDPGFTHSFIRSRFVKKIGFKTEILSYLMEVSTPTGEKKIETEKICRNYEVEICGRLYPANLISLVKNGYDVILRIDWLAQYYVQLDYRTKDVNLNVPGKPMIKLNFKRLEKHWV